MGMRTEVTYGYGIDVSKLEDDFVKYNPDFENAYDKLMLVLDDAPMFKEDYMSWLDDNMMELNEEGIQFCFTYEGFGGTGLGEILRNVIHEKYSIDLINAWDEETGKSILVYPPTYPWLMTTDERTMGQSDLDKIYNRYSMILCNVNAETDILRADCSC